MSWRREEFRAHYRATVGTTGSSDSYVSYLNLVDALIGGLDERIGAVGPEAALDWLASQPKQLFSAGRSQGNCTSALRAYARFLGRRKPSGTQADNGSDAADPPNAEVLVDLLREAKLLAARYYRLTGKPLGVTGELAELEAAERLGLQLVSARSPGFDAIRPDGHRVQIKGRAVSAESPFRGRCPSIKGDDFDSVALVLLDRESYDVLEIWEAPRERVLARIKAPGSKARNERASLGLSQFKSIAERVWPPTRP